MCSDTRYSPTKIGRMFRLPRAFAAGVFFLFLCAAGLAQGSGNIFLLLFRRSNSLVHRCALVAEMVEASDRSKAPDLAEAFYDLSRVDRSLLSPSQAEAHLGAMRLLCAALGEYRHAESQDALMALARSKDPGVLRAEALIALGKMRAVRYVDEITSMLEAINVQAVGGGPERELIAYGCVQALIRMGGVSAWPALLEASTGWYTASLKQLASTGLRVIARDPSLGAQTVIERGGLDLKLLAMEYLLVSEAPAESKLALARLGLRKSLETSGNKGTDINSATLLRKRSMDWMVQAGDRSPEALELYRLAWNTASVDGKLSILAGYGASRSEAAAIELETVISEFNQRREAGYVSDDIDRLIRTAIAAAADCRSPVVLPALSAVAANRAWSASVHKAAEDARRLIAGY